MIKGENTPPDSENARVLRGLLGDLEALTRDHDACIDDATALADNLHRRAVLVDKIVALDRAMSAWDTRADDASCDVLDECRAIARRIVDVGGAQHCRLGAQRDDLASQIAELARGRSALAAYGRRSDTRGPCFQDTRG